MATSTVLASTLILLSLVLTSTAALDGFTVDLIHRDSPKSPFHNPASSSFDRLHAATNRTFSRANFLLWPSSPSFQSTIRTDAFEYLMTLSLGTPPTNLLLIADTGSDLTWTQCNPCTNCFKPITPPFDPANSSSYKPVPCQATACRGLRQAICSGSNNACLYNLVYGDQSTTSGILSFETLGFNSVTPRMPPVSIPDMVFGCSHSTRGNFGNTASGIVGLGRGPSSLITQLSPIIGGKFSYCLVPTTDLSASSVMNFGDRAVVQGPGVVSTPLVTGPVNTFYYVTLEAVLIGDGGDKVIVNGGGAGSGSSQNMIVDSGTTLTLLDQKTIQELESKLSAVIKLPPVKVGQLFRLCFNSTQLKRGDLPEMTFNFAGALLKLSPRNTFVQAAQGVLCLAMLPNPRPVFGSISQHDFHVGFDLEANKLSFAPADCAKL